MCQCCSTLGLNSFKTMEQNLFLIVFISFISSICFQFFAENNVAHYLTLDFFLIGYIALAWIVCTCNSTFLHQLFVIMYSILCKVEIT